MERKPAPKNLAFFHYARCSTCVKAKQRLIEQGYTLDETDITTHPPSASLLADFIQKSGRPYTDFLNRSGTAYREENMKEKVARLSEQDVIRMLSENGRLIKRPIVTDGKKVTVGFSAAEFSLIWPK